jgi:hypothetical protein
MHGSKLAFMRLDFLRSKTSPSRRVSALGITCAFLFTIALSDAPRLHDYFHKALGPDHECAVTMFLSGACDHLANGAPLAGPVALTWTSFFVPRQFPSLEANLEFSLLEHAPPSLA